LDCGKNIDAKTTALSKSKPKSKIATTVLPTTTTISRKIEAREDDKSHQAAKGTSGTITS
jgi:hypothetical protein